MNSMRQQAAKLTQAYNWAVIQLLYSRKHHYALPNQSSSLAQVVPFAQVVPYFAIFSLFGP